MDLNALAVRCMLRWLSRPGATSVPQGLETLRNTSHGPPQDDGGTR